MTKVAIVYHSGFGHTEVLANFIAEGATEAGATVSLIKCQKPNMKKINEADAIIFGCPTYMGTVSAEMKKFMDECSTEWRNQTWRDKIAAGFTNSAALSGDKLNTLMQFVIFSMQHSMIWAGLDLMNSSSKSSSSPKDLNRLGSWIGLMAQSNSGETAETSPPIGDRKTAKYFGQRIVEVCNKMNKSRD